MSFILSIIRGVMSFRKEMKKLKDVKNKGKASIKAIKNAVITYCILIFLIITIIGAAIYSVTGAVSELYDQIATKWEEFWGGGSEEPTPEFYDSLTEEEKKAMVDSTGASLNIDKIGKYMQTEKDSVPSSKDGTKVTINNGTESSENVTIDISDYANKYKVNWQFVSSMDLAIFEADDISKTKAIDNASSLRPNFEWNNDYTRDTTDTWRNYTVVKEYDNKTGVTTETKNTKSSAIEGYKIVKEPLAIPNKVSTLFGDYIYSVTKDCLIKNEEYSNPYVISQGLPRFEERVDYVEHVESFKDVQYMYCTTESGFKFEVPTDINTNFSKDPKEEYKPDIKNSNAMYYSYISDVGHTLTIPSITLPYFMGMHSSVYYTGPSDVKKVATGYKDVTHYKTIRIDTYTMEETKQKILEDQVANIKQNFDPTRFIKYLNNCGLSVKDIALVRECLINIPNTNIIVDNIDRILNGDYGDIIVDNPKPNPSGGGGSMVGVLPLFLQADGRWGSKPYAGETIARAGCGPTTMAMVLSGMMARIDGLDLNKDGLVDPSEAAIAATMSGYATNGSGSYDSIVIGMASLGGLSCSETTDFNLVTESLKQGKVVVDNVAPNTELKSGNHFLVLTGLDLDGNIMMNDPNSKDNSLKGWDSNIIKKVSKKYWIIDNPSLNDTQKLILKVRKGAIEGQKKYGVYASITIAQAVIESENGKSGLTVAANNLFGIKASGGWTGKTIDMPTQEYVGGGYITIMAKWRVYQSWDDSVEDHGKFLTENSRYKENGVFSAKDYREQAQALKRAGYATAETYASVLISNIEANRWYLYDEQAIK